MLTLDEGTILVKLARQAVTEFLLEGRRISVPKNTPRKLREKRGVFVTIEKLVSDESTGVIRRILRGCIGYPEPVLPLAEATINAAISAATEDPRFPQLIPQELKQVIFEVSVLSPLQLIKVNNPQEYPQKIQVGVDGLLVESGYTRGLLLPQVAVEWGWTAEEFLSQASLKAGLPPDAWTFPTTRVYKFQAEIFAELEPNGRIIQRRPDLGYTPRKRSARVY